MDDPSINRKLRLFTERLGEEVVRKLKWDGLQHAWNSGKQTIIMYGWLASSVEEEVSQTAWGNYELFNFAHCEFSIKNSYFQSWESSLPEIYNSEYLY